MTNRLNGKIALVAAAGQGIGRAISEAFIAEGATVIATDLDPGKLDGLAAARRDKLDVRSTAAVDAFAEQVMRAFGPPDILVNCAGFVHHGSVLDCSEADWAFSFDLNVASIHRMLRAFLPGMLEKRRGSIISISSAVSSIRGVPNRYVYGATKAAIIGLTKALAADFIKQGIRANAICPGTIETPSLVSKSSHRPVDAVRQDFIDRQPRWGASALRKRSPRSRCSSPPMRRAISHDRPQVGGAAAGPRAQRPRDLAPDARRHRGAPGSDAIRLLAPLAFTPPGRVGSIMAGSAPHDFTVTNLAQTIPFAWAQ